MASGGRSDSEVRLAIGIHIGDHGNAPVGVGHWRYLTAATYFTGGALNLSVRLQSKRIRLHGCGIFDIRLVYSVMGQVPNQVQLSRHPVRESRTSWLQDMDSQNRLIHLSSRRGPRAMSEQRLVPAQEARHEIKVVNSRFIATAGPATTLDEAKALIARVRQEYPDATHHVPAFVIGHGNSVITHCQDAGEPPGTAGRPALAVLQGSGLGDVAVVVTRYFGGTKLGTGGLIRAYGDAVRGVLAILPRARKVATHTVGLTIPYAGFQRVRRLLETHHAQLTHQEFGAEVTLTARLAVDEFEVVQSDLRNIFNGAVQAEILETNQGSLLPLVPDLG
ncbi:MAG: YigZ family protein [Acidobacteriota bacterium]